MLVYNGVHPLGEIKDYGRHCIKAYVYVGDYKPILIGTYSDRRTAIGAVSEAAERQGGHHHDGGPL